MGSSIFLNGSTNSGISTNSATSPGAGLGGGPDPAQFAGAVEAKCQGAMSQGGTFSNYFVTVSANARITDSTYTVRINATPTSMSITYTSGQTGTKSDTTHTATVAQNDLISTAITTSTGGGLIAQTFGGFRFDPTSGTTASFIGSSAAGASLSGTGPITDFLQLVSGAIAGGLVEANQQFNVPFAGTARYYQAEVDTNARTTDTVFTFRKNAADGAQTFTYTSGQTGLKKDTSNTDAISAADKVAGKIQLGTGTGAIVVCMQAFFQDATTDGQSAVALVRSAGRSLTAATTLWNILGGSFSMNVTEGVAQGTLGTAATASKLWCRVLTNASTTDSLVKLRKGGADGNQVVTMTALTTGDFQDTTHSDSCGASDLLDYQFSGATTGSVVLTGVSMMLVVSGGSVFTPYYFVQHIARMAA